MKKHLGALLFLSLILSLCLPALSPAALADGADRDEAFAQALSLIFPTDSFRAPQAALDLLLPLAQAGDAEAQYYCGWIYDFELEENTETEAEAYKWYKLAAEQSHAKACVGAALNSFSESYDDYMNKAFELGFWAMSGDELGPDGYFWLGFMYNYGFAVEKDPTTAYIYYSAAADMNSPLAMFDLGYMHDTGIGAEYDVNLARMWYSSAAELGHVSSMYSLGCSYLFGSGTDEEYQQAFEWFSQAAQLGHSDSMAQLGELYGSGLGTAENNALAFEWYSRAVELGNTHAMCMLGHMYRDGVYVEEDDNMAMDYFIEAAVKGNISAPYVVDMMIAFNEGMDTYYAREAEYLAATAG